ncbi:MAG: NRAMP family divalent metal transporter [Anaerovoracaceae bacterium]
MTSKKTKTQSEKGKTSQMIGAALLMATSAVGPGFLTQSATFTATYLGSLALVILCVIAMDMITQVNVWSIVGVTGLRAQDLANKVCPGLGYVIAVLVASGGLIFNIANVGGISLGLSALFGLPVKAGCILGGALAICVFSSKQANRGMDRLTKVLACVIILAALVVAISTKPPVGEIASNLFQIDNPAGMLLPMITILGGSCGGYISFAGAHRLLDANITGPENLGNIRKSVLLGTSVSGCVRLLMFLATYGVCMIGGTAAAQSIIAADNPAAQTFYLALNTAGYKIFGLVLFCASLTSVVGAAYTSVSFLKTLHPAISANEKKLTIGFIIISTIIMAVFGGAAKLLVAAGAVNGLILPVTLSVVLIAGHKKSIVGEKYHHSKLLTAAGILIACLTLYAGIISISNLLAMF